MRLLRPLLLLLLLPFPAAADENARLCELIRLWSAVRYHHPFLYDRDVDWDAAFVAAVPRVRAAANDAERIEALKAMLALVGDTRARRDEELEAAVALARATLRGAHSYQAKP